MELRKVIIPHKYMPTPKFSYIETYNKISYAITISGRLYVWGGEQHEVFFHGLISPTEIDIGYRVNYISFGDDFAIAITEDGMVNYMGDPEYNRS